MINLKHKLIHPWPNHFKDNYPEESHELIDSYMDKFQRISIQVELFLLSI